MADGRQAARVRISSDGLLGNLLRELLGTVAEFQDISQRDGVAIDGGLCPQLQASHFAAVAGGRKYRIQNTEYSR
jgi:hypothetical protein